MTDNRIKLTLSMIVAGANDHGAWRHEQLALLNIPSPPDRLWLKKAIGSLVDGNKLELFLSMSGKLVPPLDLLRDDDNWLSLAEKPAKLAQPASVQLLQAAIRLRGAAIVKGMMLTVKSYFQNGLQHLWMIDRVIDGHPLLDFRPSRGRWHCPGTNQEGRIENPYDLIREASRRLQEVEDQPRRSLLLRLLPRPKRIRTPSRKSIRATQYDATQVEKELQLAAQAYDLDLAFERTRAGKNASQRWILSDIGTGERILEYWPDTGKWRNPNTEDSGIVTHPTQALALAVRMAERDCSS